MMEKARMVFRKDFEKRKEKKRTDSDCRLKMPRTTRRVVRVNMTETASLYLRISWRRSVSVTTVEVAVMMIVRRRRSAIYTRALASGRSRRSSAVTCRAYRRGRPECGVRRGRPIVVCEPVPAPPERYVTASQDRPVR